MLGNYLTLAWRHMLRHRAYTAVNVAGLSVGVAFCLVAWRFVAFELSYDTFHEKADRVFRVTSTFHSRGDGDALRTGLSHDKVGPALATEIPQIVRTARLDFQPELLVQTPGGSFEVTVAWAEPQLLEILSFPVVAGDAVRAAGSPGHTVISESLARRMFGRANAVGETVALRDREDVVEMQVGAVIAIPANSTFHFDVLRPFELAPERGGASRHTFVELVSPTAAPQVEVLLPAFTRALFGKYDIVHHLQPLTAMHLTDAMQRTPNATSPVYCWVLAGIAGVVLIIACVNFINLSMALAAGRFQEVGLRKTLGAARAQVMRQFLAEAGVLTAFAVVLGAMLAEILLPSLSVLMDRQLEMGVAGLWLPAIGLAALLASVTGAYPAWVLSRPQPVDLLGGAVRFGGPTTLSRVLVGIQLGLSVLLAVAALIASEQVNYLLTKDMGFDREQVVIVDSGSFWDRGQEQALEIRHRYRDLLDDFPDVSAVSGNERPLGTGREGGGMDLYNQGDTVRCHDAYVDYDIVKTLGLQLVEGRDFSISEDRAREWPQLAVIVNQSLVRALGWESAVGRVLPESHRRGVKTVVGVVEDFHLRSLHQEILPLVMPLQTWGSFQHYYVRIAPHDIPRTLARLEEAWQQVSPDLPFRYTFLDEAMRSQYRQEQRWGRIVRWGAALAVAIAAIGAMALASLAATRRTKEIGVRKVLGATAADVVSLLTREFAWLGAAASVLAWVGAYAACQRWLGGFAYRIELGMGPFALGAIAVVGTVLLVVGSQAARAARANVADALRYE